MNRWQSDGREKEPTFQYGAQELAPPDPITRQLDPVHSLTLHFEIHFKVRVPPLRLPTDPLT
jgi:hypothetical protein